MQTNLADKRRRISGLLAGPGPNQHEGAASAHPSLFGKCGHDVGGPESP